MENRLISANKSNTSVSYQYNAQGQRISKTHNGTVKQYLYDGADLIALYDSGGNLIQRYVHGAGVDAPLVGYDYTQGNLQARHWYYADPQGSVIATADDAGRTEQIYTYSPFGEPGQTGSSIFRYTGQVWDEETRLAYYKARYYSPKRGRFLSADPAGYVDSLNLYGYVVNDPVNLVDPSGLLLAASLNWVGDAASLFVETGNDVISQTSGHPAGTFLGLHGISDNVSTLNAAQNGDFTGVVVGLGLSAVNRVTGGLAKIDPKKFGYLFGRTASNAHNAARSNQLSLEMKRLGISDNLAGRSILSNHFDDIVRLEGNVLNTFSNKHGNFEVRNSLLFGPSGKATSLESTFEIMSDGARRFVTTIPKR